MRKYIPSLVFVFLLCFLACCKYREAARGHVSMVSNRIDSIVIMNYGCQPSHSDTVDLIHALNRLDSLDSRSHRRPRWVRREELGYSHACRTLIYLYLNPNVHPAVFSTALQEYTRRRAIFQARVSYP